MTLRQAWESEARNWIAWARRPGFDSYWRFHRDRFFELLPAPPARVLDIGCGEGRLPRDLAARGYEVAGVDGSATLVEAAREADPGGDYRVANAASLPFEDGAFDLAVSFMALHDVDDLDGAAREIGRIVGRGGAACVAVVHPINSGGNFASEDAAAPFVMEAPYFEERRYTDVIERDGLPMTFSSFHHPLQAYLGALLAAGFVVDRLTEVTDPTDRTGRWSRIPLFLDFRAVKLPVQDAASGAWR